LGRRNDRDASLSLVPPGAGNRGCGSVADRLSPTSKALKLTFDEQECLHAVAHYAKSKMQTKDPSEFEVSVQIQWRGRTATAEVRRKVPVLTDRVPEPTE
jgi:hypothetical protein